jgi:D-alanyl-D-alanine carboxypeptidase
MVDISLNEFMVRVAEDKAPEETPEEAEVSEDQDKDAPVTMEEWATYIGKLNDNEELYQVALAAGRFEFGQKLLAEGYSAEDVATLRAAIAKKMASQGVAPPGRVGGNKIDYRRLADFEF